jgi:hypothetical protein
MMKSLFLAALFMLGLVKVTMAAEPTRLAIEVDTDKMQYRVCLHFESNELEYDALDLVPPATGFAPRRVRAFLKDASGKAIPCGNTDGGYSSYEMYSGSPLFKSSFKKAPASKVLFSEWYSFQDLLRGFGLASGVSPDRWGSLQLKFAVAVQGKSPSRVTGESEWIFLSPAARRALGGG